MGILNDFENYTDHVGHVKFLKGVPGPAGRDGVGFKLTEDGNYDLDGKRLTDVADSIDDSDAVNLKVLKEHTQVSQNNYHLQPRFQFQCPKPLRHAITLKINYLASSIGYNCNRVLFFITI